jgi:hypothetical protein
MTPRYMKHAPESYFSEDAAKVAAAIIGGGTRKPRRRQHLPA